MKNFLRLLLLTALIVVASKLLSSDFSISETEHAIIASANK